MRTLIINAVYTIKNNKVIYKGTMYGQKNKNEYCQYITEFTIISDGYNDFIDECKNKFIKYFDLDDGFNITTIDNISGIHYLFNQLTQEI